MSNSLSSLIPLFPLISNYHSRTIGSFYFHPLFSSIVFQSYPSPVASIQVPICFVHCPYSYSFSICSPFCHHSFTFISALLCHLLFIFSSVSNSVIFYSPSRLFLPRQFSSAPHLFRSYLPTSGYSPVSNCGLFHQCSFLCVFAMSCSLAGTPVTSSSYFFSSLLSLLKCLESDRMLLHFYRVPILFTRTLSTHAYINIHSNTYILYRSNRK
jgi:hypothetical protein